MSDVDGSLIVSGFIFNWGEPDVNGITMSKDTVLSMVEHFSTIGEIEVDEENRRVLWTVDFGTLNLTEVEDPIDE